MKVLVASASGTIGKPLIPALVAANHSVIGMTTSSAGIQALSERGADGLVLNALDRQAVEREIKRIRPDAIIDELTSLPKRYTPEEMKAAAPRDAQVRLEGGGNLFRAAGEAGVKRYLVQSTGFFYASGVGLASEADPLAINATPGVSGSAIRYTQIEDRTFSDPRIGGQYPVIDPGTGVFSFIHVEDAAAATVAALEGNLGVYNIVDDNPVPMAVWIATMSEVLTAATNTRPLYGRNQPKWSQAILNREGHNANRLNDIR